MVLSLPPAVIVDVEEVVDVEVVVEDEVVDVVAKHHLSFRKNNLWQYDWEVLETLLYSIFNLSRFLYSRGEKVKQTTMNVLFLCFMERENIGIPASIDEKYSLEVEVVVLIVAANTKRTV
jgi:hypothetical protein